MNGFLTKPLEIARLHETLDRYGLGRRRLTLSPRRRTIDAENVPVDLATPARTHGRRS